MGREKDRFWQHVVKLENGRFKCNFCLREFAGGISRIKSHLAKVEGRGIKICEKVPKQVERDAYEEIKSASRKRKRLSCSTDDDESNAALATSPPEQNNEAENGAGRDVDREQIGDQSMEKEAGTGADEGNPMENMIPDMIQLEDMDELFEGLGIRSHQNTTGEALLPRKDEYPEFQGHMDDVWKFLNDDEVSIIAICGMAGVGKTTLAIHVHNQLLVKPNAFLHVFWITLPKDASLDVLQNLVAKAIGLDLSSEEDEKKRAAKLSRELAVKQKHVLLLDNLWHDFDLHEVGIPGGVDGSKLIITTSRIDVCKRMGCKVKLIKVNPLSEKEAWKLFVEETWNNRAVPKKVEPIAKSIVKECAGLSLGIITMARSMRGVEDVCQWRNTLRQLKGSKAGQADHENKMFSQLKSCYYNLNDSELQLCFLHCALFPMHREIQREKLIDHLIVVGAIKGMKSREAAFDEGHAMLNKLENACLLESVIDEQNGRCVKMHALIRIMALQIIRENCSVMVETGQQLKAIPDLEDWKEDLVIVSLMDNVIKEIPSTHSPNCPLLSTLLLGDNEDLKVIESSFLENLTGLKILDLSFTGIERLPDSVSNLVNLTALLLRRCKKLRFIPSLAKLLVLQKLDLSFTMVEEVQGLESLSNLTYLNLHETEIRELDPMALANLSRLQYLMLGSAKTSVDTVKGLKKLETLEFTFCNVEDFNGYVRILKDGDELHAYRLQLGHKTGPLTICGTENGDYHNSVTESEFTKQVWLFINSTRRGDNVVLPEDIQQLGIAKFKEKDTPEIDLSLSHGSSVAPETDLRSLSHGSSVAQEIDLKSLSHGLSFKEATDLKSLLITGCDEMEWLFSMPQHEAVTKSLEKLCIHGLKKLSFLLMAREAAALTSSNGTFSNLKRIKIFRCPNMKRLFPPGLLPNLQNLEEIEIRRCENMEEIIGLDEEYEEENWFENYYSVYESSSNTKNNHGSSKDHFTLPKLKSLSLKWLPQLKSICSCNLICSSLQKITVWDCQKLKKMPISMRDQGHLSVPPSLKEIEVTPMDWWESVELDHPMAKDALRRLLRIEIVDPK